MLDQCPDCATPDRLDDPIVMDTTKLSLQRFNAESTLANFFSLQHVTRASSQHKGFCRATHTSYNDSMVLPQLILRREGVVLPNKPPVEVTCEIYEPEAARGEEQVQGSTLHTHLHAGEPEHSSGPSSGPGPTLSSRTPINTEAPLGNVRHSHPRYRPSPEASSCPGPRRHNLGFEKLNL
ncbi:hypothetical protein CRUP_033886 [Coryphaenoides rupestris]|nr:hypothetical protein CRUP_033886 [Coryphaenoides rupestris]